MVCNAASKALLQASNSASGRFNTWYSRAKLRNSALFKLPPVTKLATFKRACMSLMRPDKNTCSAKPSRSVSVPPGAAAKKLDKRASRKGVAHGSAKWSVLPDRPSSRSTTRDQSWAPTNSQCACCASRSAVSTDSVRHCCHRAEEANTAIKATVSKAISKAAPFCLRVRSAGRAWVVAIGLDLHERAGRLGFIFGLPHPGWG